MVEVLTLLTPVVLHKHAVRKLRSVECEYKHTVNIEMAHNQDTLASIRFQWGVYDVQRDYVRLNLQ